MPELMSIDAFIFRPFVAVREPLIAGVIGRPPTCYFRPEWTTTNQPVMVGHSHWRIIKVLGRNLDWHKSFMMDEGWWHRGHTNRWDHWTMGQRLRAVVICKFSNWYGHTLSTDLQSGSFEYHMVTWSAIILKLDAISWSVSDVIH